MQLTTTRMTGLRRALTALPLTVAACGGGSDAGSGLAENNNERATAVSKAAVAAAASAAATENVSPEIAMKVHAQGMQDDAMIDRFIIKYKNGSTERKNTDAVRQKLTGLATAFPAKARHLRRMGTGSDVVTSDRKLNAREAKAFMRAIASDPDVEYIEPDVEMSVQMVPNDPYYGTQWYLRSNEVAGVTQPGIRPESAWDIAKGDGQVIAIVDTGVTSHSDFNAKLLPGLTIGGNDPATYGMNKGYPDLKCVYWHGTHVAGIAAAESNNGIGIAGVAPAAKMVSIAALSSCGTGATSSVADGIIWAAGGTVPNAPPNSNPATVINLSLAKSNPCLDTLQEAIDFATSKGAVVVAAAGNASADAAKYQPGNCQNVITVGGTNAVGGSYVSSNFGPVVDISAPGSDIWSTYNNGKDLPGGESYSYMSGTSMATPMVAGAIALARSVAPRPLTTAEFRSLLQQNAQPFPVKPGRELGPGILDVTRTVLAAKSGAIPLAADFKCVQDNFMFMGVHCDDLSTARGGAPIVSRVWNTGGADRFPAEWSTNNTALGMFYPDGGFYTVKLTVTDSNGVKSTFARPVWVVPPPTQSLTPGVPAIFSGKWFDRIYYKTKIPAGVKSLTVKVKFGNSKESGFVYVNNRPSDYIPACETRGSGPDFLTCTVDSPKEGDWYTIVNINSNTAVANVVLTYD
ncbi:MAG: S8 family serine peptidase [Paraburkholderia sp.]|jgi:serine protease|nr:S8 family serine peptidase [Paraburkholderia sp.]